MSDRSVNRKKRKGTNGDAVPIKVGFTVSGSPTPSQEHPLVVPARRDYHSKLTPIQRLLRVESQKHDDVNAVKEALRNIADLCADGNAHAENNRATLLRSQGLSTIVGAMEKWGEHPAIQKEGCRALQNASFNNDGIKNCLKDTGGIDAVIWAMKKNPISTTVQISGFEALSNFVTSVKSNAEYVVQGCNGVGLVVAAMNTFKDNAKLQEVATHALCKLLKYDDLKEAIASANGLRLALVHAIENHKDESKDRVKELQENARSALKQLL